MDLHTVQLIFYTLGSIFFLSLIIFIVFISVTFYIVKKRISRMSNEVTKKVLQARELYDHKEKYILRFLGKGSSSIIETISKIFVKGKK